MVRGHCTADTVRLHRSLTDIVSTAVLHQFPTVLLGAVQVSDSGIPATNFAAGNRPSQPAGGGLSIIPAVTSAVLSSTDVRCSSPGES